MSDLQQEVSLLKKVFPLCHLRKDSALLPNPPSFNLFPLLVIQVTQSHPRHRTQSSSSFLSFSTSPVLQLLLKDAVTTGAFLPQGPGENAPMESFQKSILLALILTASLPGRDTFITLR